VPEDALTQIFLPIVTAAAAEAGPAQEYNMPTGQGARFGSVDAKHPVRKRHHLPSQSIKAECHE
jgi:hypothetical protein